MPLGLDLVGDDQSALARFLDLERIALNALGVEEPAGHLGEPEQLQGAVGERWISGGDGRRPGGRRVREERLPAPERRRRRRAALAMELERLGHQAEGAYGLCLDPRKLLRRAQRGQLGLEAALGDVPTGDLGDADHVVEDQRAERAAAVGAFEQDPGGPRPAAVDPREPGADGVRRAPPDHRRRRRRGGRREAPLREPIERPLRRPAH